VIQLALGRGLKVIGTASERNHDYLSSLGAIPLAYGPGLAARVANAAPEGIDGALDISGAGVINDLITIVGNAAMVISIADFTAPRHGARISSGATRTTNPRDAFAEAIALPHFTLNIEHKYPLEDISAAHQHIERGHTVGKLIVTP
jgi:NADPH:quinone reductase-like Zn-dependent oxidoreductase